MTAPNPSDMSWPRLRPMGLSGLLVSFAGQFSDTANRAALAFRAAVEQAAWPGVEETAPSLVSVFLRLDPLAAADGAIEAKLTALLNSRDWFAAPLPDGRVHWRIPTVLGTELAPGFTDAVALAGVSETTAIKELSETRLRVLTIGFAPGLPYLGLLPAHWDLPRMTELNPNVPEGALVQAIRQTVLFSRPSPTGWRHVGQTAFRGFRPQGETPFPLNPGDEVSFVPADRDLIERLLTDPAAVDGGAEREALP